MNILLKSTLCLAATLGMHAAVAQQNKGIEREAAVSGEVAYVYVSVRDTGTGAGSHPNRIEGFAADAQGRLTPMSGSPFAGDVTGMVLNGRYLFGMTNDGSDAVDSFSIAGSGALKLAATTNTHTNNASGCTGLGSMILDHTGTSLYVPVTVGSSLCDSEQYQSYSVEESTGKLGYIGSTAPKFLYQWPLTFTGNNEFAYGTECIDYEGGLLDTFGGFKRMSDGMLEDLTTDVPTPKAKASGSYYCRSLAAADPANHLVVSMQAIDVYTSSPVGLAQLGTYSADKYGNLYTQSTYSNMPVTAVGDVGALSTAPSGALVAVGGDAGVQVFHLSTTTGIRPYTGLLTHDDVSRVTSASGLMFWDNANHLYALSPATGKLHVFTVTVTEAVEAPGSPYTIALPQNLIVLPKTTFTPTASPADGDADKD